MLLKNCLEKNIAGEIDYRSLYEVMNSNLKSRDSFSDADSYYSYKTTVYNNLATIGMQLTPQRLYKKIAFVVGKQVDDIFLGFLKSNTGPKSDPMGLLSFRQ